MEQRDYFRRFQALVAVTVAVVFLAGCMPTAEGKLFTVVDPATSKACVLVDVDVTLSLTAEREGSPVADVELTSEDSGINVIGSCGNVSSLINLFFPEGANWILKFTQQSNGDVYLNKLVQFNPKRVFGGQVPSTDYQLMDDPGLTDLGSGRFSYECSVPDVAEYEPVEVTTTDTNFTVVANISYIKAQAFNVKDGNFSTPTYCNAEFTTTPLPNATTPLPNATTPLPNATTTQAQTTTPMFTTTSKPTPPQNLYIVKDHGVVCIALTAKLTLNIEYNLKGQKGKTRTGNFIIPSTAGYSGNCSLSATSQILTISFFENWELSYVFSTAKKGLFSLSKEDNPKHPSYHISEIMVTFYANEKRFPGSDFLPGSKHNVTSGKLNSPKVSGSQGFYKCDSSLDTKVTPTVVVHSEMLELKAFNNDSSTNFTGSAAVCSADSGSSKRTTYIIVGCVLAGIVVLCLIVFIVMRVLRRRRETYSSI